MYKGVGANSYLNKTVTKGSANAVIHCYVSHGTSAKLDGCYFIRLFCHR